jgi:hypothetical protein
MNLFAQSQGAAARDHQLPAATDHSVDGHILRARFRFETRRLLSGIAVDEIELNTGVPFERSAQLLGQRWKCRNIDLALAACRREHAIPFRRSARLPVSIRLSQTAGAGAKPRTCSDGARKQTAAGNIRILCQDAPLSTVELRLSCADT